jgi:hypothetical protein
LQLRFFSSWKLGCNWKYSVASLFATETFSSYKSCCKWDFYLSVVSQVITEIILQLQIRSQLRFLQVTNRVATIFLAKYFLRDFLLAWCSVTSWSVGSSYVLTFVPVHFFNFFLCFPVVRHFFIIFGCCLGRLLPPSRFALTPRNSVTKLLQRRFDRVTSWVPKEIYTTQPRNQGTIRVFLAIVTQCIMTAFLIQYICCSYFFLFLNQLHKSNGKFISISFIIILVKFINTLFSIY